MTKKLIFEVSGLNSQGQEVFPRPEHYPEFFKMIEAMIDEIPGFIRKLIEDLERQPEAFNIVGDTLDVFIMPPDRPVDNTGAPMDKAGDIVLLHDTEVLVNEVRLRVYFMIDPNLVGLETQSILSVTDQVPPNDAPLN
jgi:hypothetical protein